MYYTSQLRRNYFRCGRLLRPVPFRIILFARQTDIAFHHVNELKSNTYRLASWPTTKSSTFTKPYWMATPMPHAPIVGRGCGRKKRAAKSPLHIFALALRQQGSFETPRGHNTYLTQSNSMWLGNAPGSTHFTECTDRMFVGNIGGADFKNASQPCGLSTLPQPR